MASVTVILPSRNEPYLEKTILDMLEKADTDIEIIAVLDGYWEDIDKIVDDPSVSYIHFPEPRGMRAGINAGVALSRSDYILKCDAHIMMSQGFDSELLSSCTDSTVVVPRRYPLDPEKWEIEKRTDNKYPIDYMYLSKDLQGVLWKERDRDRSAVMVDDLMSSQGSCWFMPKKLFHELELMDEDKYGIFWNEFQEIGLKAWLSGNRVIINKYCWYAHWHKTNTRGYSLPPEEKKKAREMVERYKGTEKLFSGQIRTLDWLIKYFEPPGWDV